MRKGVVCVALLASAVTGWGQSAKEAKAETVARWQFVGTKQVSDQKDLTALRDIIALPESLELRNVAIDVVSRRLAERFTRSADTNVNARVAALVKPLLPDLVESENRFELVAKSAQDADWLLSVRLAPERATEWSRNLTELANAARMQVTPGKEGAWMAGRENYRFSFTQQKGWVVLEGALGASAHPGKRLKANLGRTGKEILTAELNLPRIAEFWNFERLKHAPRLNLAVAPRRGLLRSEMEIDYPQPLNIKPEPWTPPTGLIHDPLVGFTAIQGISDRLAKSEEFRKLGAGKTPNQAYLWSQGTMAFTVFAATDVGNPGTVVSNVVTQLLPQIKRNPGGSINVLTNRPGIIWRGLPVVVPFLEAAEEGRSPFLTGGLFPVSAKNPKPAPPELYAQLKKKNLVYYDWEITQERMKQWRAIWQFTQILQGKLFPASVSDRWIDAIMPKLENSVTEVTLEKKNKLKLVRNSQTGLTALELVLLSHLIDPNDVIEPRRRPPGQLPAAPKRNNPAPPKR